MYASKRSSLEDFSKMEYVARISFAYLFAAAAAAVAPSEEEVVVDMVVV